MYSSCEEQEFGFFDAQDSIEVNYPVSEPDESSSHGVEIEFQVDDFQYDIWANAPVTSVYQRKNTFLKLMGLSSDDKIVEEITFEDHVSIMSIVDDRIMQTSDAVLRTPTPIEEEEEQQQEQQEQQEQQQDCSITSPISDVTTSCSDVTISCSSSTVSRIRDSNGGEEENGCKEVIVSNPEIIPTPLIEKFAETHISLKVAGTMVQTMNRVKGQFLGRLKSMASIVDKQIKRSESLRSSSSSSSSPSPSPSSQRLRVHQNKKRMKELTAVFIGQDFQAHEGSILTMKFSRDGRYLASAGEDMIVRVWEIVEDERSNKVDIPEVDPSCLYFTVNDFSEIAPLMAEKEKQKLTRLKSMRKTKNSACVVFPPKVFRILEKPVHEFHGHTGHVLDLSWSNDNLLLSSSVDESVRLWRVGNGRCLKVFPHSNYVTCVQFQPLNQNYFLSGSIDGKVRMWSISRCQVVDWIDLREIVTAVAYNPDGKGGIIGTMTGACSFFGLSENGFQLEASVSLNNNKKTPCKRIIGFQFCPQDQTKVMVTSADAHIRILDGVNVVGKFRGQKNGNQIFATFTLDGKYVVSTTEDSQVYIYDCHNQKGPCFSQNKTIRSYECFSSSASVALPWSGFNGGSGGGEVEEDGLCRQLPPCFSLGQDYFQESIPKGSATWPEENLPSSSPMPPGGNVSSPSCKSKYKFFKSCKYNCPMWGLVIVTAGWDGRIRSFLNYGLPVNV